MPETKLSSCLALISLVVCAGCASTPARSLDSLASAHRLEQAAGNHQPVANVFTNLPSHRPTTAQKFNPCFWFANLDDPLPPDSYRPDDSHRIRKWYWRNSCHNFTFYVMGIADKQFVRVGRYPGRVFCPNSGWNWAICKYRCLRLPFVSYQRGHFKGYFGWRERGNFGIKLNLWASLEGGP